MRAFAILVILWVAAVSRGFATPADVSAIDASIREKSGHGSTNAKVFGDWALSDEQADGVRVAVAVLRKINDHWVVTAELNGAGYPTVEALLYHEMPEQTVNHLLEGQARDEMKPIMKLLRGMNRAIYPEGYLFENIAIADRWALCNFRSRASLRKSDVLGQILLRRTDGKWHLVEQADHAIDLRPYGIPAKVQRVLHGESPSNASWKGRPTT